MKVAFYTLGCKVNQYESTALMEEFISRGCSIVSNNEIADLYVINTCTVTHLADRKSRQNIRRMKKLNPDSILAVVGCYAEISPEEIEAIKGVDIILGNKDKSRLPEIVFNRFGHRNGYRDEKDNKGLIFGDQRTRAHIKIQDGCDRFCSYCIIPYARGPVVSRNLDDILEEAQQLVDKGYKELVLTGINTALYGKDLNESSKGRSGKNIEFLIEKLSELSGEFRIRLGSLEPNVIDYRLAESLLKYEKLCHHMHLSLQSGSDKILKAMNRRYLREDFNKIIRVLRQADPHYGISTDVIVGFPGETEEDFADSIKVIRDNRFVKTHAFPYSPREGTKAAKMKDHIDGQTKKNRNSLMLQAARESAEAYIQGILGKTNRVLIEEYDSGKNLLIGHGDNYVKNYIRIGEEGQEEYINTFVEVVGKEAYGDGVLADIK